MNNNITSNICDAIEMLVDRAISTAPFDKTVQGTVLSCLDEKTGKYSVRYQDSSIQAFAATPEVLYKKDDYVNILIPSNDSSKPKTIVGIAKYSNADVKEIFSKDDIYDKVGGNCFVIGEEKSFTLTRQKDEPTEEEILYYPSRGIKRIDISDSFQTNFMQAQHLKIQAQIATKFDFGSNPSDGNYGLKISVQMSNPQTEETKTVDFILDETDIPGNPFVSTTKMVSKVFDTDYDGFINWKVVKVALYAGDFPFAEGKNGTIKFNKLSFQFLKDRYDKDTCLVEVEYKEEKKTVESEKEGDPDVEKDFITFTAGIIDNQKRVMAESLMNQAFYWFIEDGSVTSKDNKNYSEVGGEGWSCFNEKDSNGAFIVNGIYTISYDKTKLTTKENKFKCVVLYKENICSTEIDTEEADNNKYKLSITTTDGVKEFLRGVGSTKLTCFIKKNGSAVTGKFQYKWSMSYSNGNYTFLKKTNTNSLVIDIEDIAGEIVYKCYVEEVKESGNVKIGSTSIKLNNYNNGKKTFTLELQNGEQDFIYNKNGVRKDFSTGLTKSAVKTLGFDIIIDGKDKVVESIKKACKIKWLIPAENTLIDLPEEVKKDLEEKDGYYTIENETSINYIPKLSFNSKATDNTIVLTVSYSDTKMTAKTKFTITKEGDPGTNGTDTICRIVPGKGNYKYFPYPFYNVSTAQFNFSGGLQVELFQGGNRVELTDKDRIEWFMLTNSQDKYSNFVPISDKVETRCTLSYRSIPKGSKPANILRCKITHQMKEYYATLPIATVTSTSRNFIGVQEGSGFSFVKYTSAGAYPEYANGADFTFERYDTSTKKPVVLNADYTVAVIGSYLDKKLKPSERCDGYDITNAIEVKVRSGGVITDSLHFPIYFYLDIYDLPGLADWDGNSIRMNNEVGEEIILAPRVAAGKKNPNNSFTGVLMGEIKNPAAIGSEVGLFGYKEGSRTFFIDAETGNAAVGGIQITANTLKDREIVSYGGLRSNDYTEGESGFNITNDGNAEFNNVKVRGEVESKTGKIAELEITKNGLQSKEFKQGELGFQIKNDGSAEFNNITVRGAISINTKILDMPANKTSLNTASELNQTNDSSEFPTLASLFGSINTEVQDKVSTEVADETYLNKIDAEGKYAAKGSLNDYVLINELQAKIEALESLVLDLAKVKFKDSEAVEHELQFYPIEDADGNVIQVLGYKEEEKSADDE